MRKFMNTKLQPLKLSKAQRMAAYIRVRDIIMAKRYNDVSHFICPKLQRLFAPKRILHTRELKKTFPEFWLFLPSDYQEEDVWFRWLDFDSPNEDRVFVLQLCIEMLKK